MERNRLEQAWIHADTYPEVRVQKESPNPQAYTRYVNALISQGFIVKAYDGYGIYKVIGVCVADNGLMQITYQKKEYTVCDVVEWKHPFMLEPY